MARSRKPVTPRTFQIRRLAIALLAAVALGGIAWVVLASPLFDEEGGDLPGVSGGSVSPPKERPWGDVQYLFETASDEGTRTSVYFISEGNDGDILKDAMECVDEELAAGRAAASCYGFDSTAALELANPTESGMETLCWRAYHSAAETDEGTGGKTGDQYETEGCP